jgi:hypothetical protein
MFYTKCLRSSPDRADFPDLNVPASDPMGEAKRKRAMCPVIQAPIAPSECGSKRISQYACPASCPANPWTEANYERVLDLGGGLLHSSLQRLSLERQRAGLSIRPSLPRGGTTLENYTSTKECLFEFRPTSPHKEAESSGACSTPALNHSDIVHFPWLPCWAPASAG